MVRYYTVLYYMTTQYNIVALGKVLLVLDEASLLSSASLLSPQNFRNLLYRTLFLFLKEDGGGWIVFGFALTLWCPNLAPPYIYIQVMDYGYSIFEHLYHNNQ